MRTTGVSIVVAGPTWAGKTTAVSALLAAGPVDRLSIVFDDDSDEAWRTSREERRDLARTALALNLELLCLDDVSGEEAVQVLMAANLGCGVLAAVHSPTASLALDVLAMLARPSWPTLGYFELRAAFYKAVDVVIFCDADHSHSRRQITEISVVASIPAGGA